MRFENIHDEITVEKSRCSTMEKFNGMEVNACLEQITL